MSKRKLRFAAVGMGKMGILHTGLLNTFSEVEIVALCDKSRLMNRIFKKVFATSDIQILDDIEKLEGLSLDAVYVTTPIASHSFIIKDIYARKIARNIFVEKTLASNYVQSKELCKIAQKSGGNAMVGYMKRFSVVFGKAKELLSQGTLGEPKVFRAYAYSSDYIGLTKESQSSASRGGALSDLGSHVIDLVIWILGNLEVSDVLSVSSCKVGSETSASFKMKNNEKLSGQIDISQSVLGYRMPEFGLSVECAKGKIDVTDDRLCLTLPNGSQKKWYRHDLNDAVRFSLGEPEYYRENAHFINSLANNQRCISSFDEASFVDQIIDNVRNWSSQNE